MSRKNLVESNTESECDFYSEYWEENIVHINKDLVDSHSESDLHFHQKSQCNLSGKEKRKSKWNETKPFSNITDFTNCCKHCPLLQSQKLVNAGKFQVKLSPESTLHLSPKDDNTSSHQLKTFSLKCDGSYKDDLYLNIKIPYMFASENSIKGHPFHTLNETYTFDKLHQKQSSDAYLSTGKHDKAVQVFFPCRDSEGEENTISDYLKQSAGFDEINKIRVKKPTVCQRIESQPVKDNLDYSSGHLYRTNCPSKDCLNTTSREFVISLTVEASYVKSATSLEEDSRRSTLPFKFKDPEDIQLVKKLYVSFVPGSLHINTEKPKQTKASTKKTEHSQLTAEDISHVLAGHTESSEGSHPLTVDTESSESSSSSIQSDQTTSTLKDWTPQFIPSFKDSHPDLTSNFCVRSLPHCKLTSTYRTSQCQKGSTKASRPVTSILFSKNKKRKDQQFKSKCSISKFHWHKALNAEPRNRNVHKPEEINDLYYVPLAQPLKCCCSPLLDLTIDLYSAERDSSKLLRVHKTHKKTGVGKVTPRFSSHFLLNPVSSFERFQYLSPVRRKNNLKMKNILNYCLGWTGRQNTHKNKEDVFPIPVSSNIRENDTFFPNTPAEEWSSTIPLLSSSRNTSVPLSTPLSHSNERCSPLCLKTGQRSPTALYLLHNEQGHPPVSFVQTERHIWSPAASYSDGKCSISHTPSCANIIQPQKERNLFNNTCVGELDYGSNQITCKDLFSKKLSVCSCGIMPQCGLFPKEYASESVRKKTRSNSDINWAVGMTKSNRVNSPGTCNTEEACCASCHHVFPLCSLHNTGSQASKNQFIKVASFENGFPTKNLKEDVVQKTLKTGDRKNVRFNVGSTTPQEICSSGTHTPLSSNDGFQMPKHFTYHSECPCCQNTMTEYFDASRRMDNCFDSEHKRLKNCLNRESVFLVKCGQGVRSQCQCSQEIPLISTDQTDLNNGNNGRRAIISERKKSEHIQNSSQNNHGWRRPYGNHKCCQYSYLQ